MSPVDIFVFLLLGGFVCIVGYLVIKSNIEAGKDSKKDKK